MLYNDCSTIEARRRLEQAYAIAFGIELAFAPSPLEAEDRVADFRRANGLPS